MIRFKNYMTIVWETNLLIENNSVCFYSRIRIEIEVQTLCKAHLLALQFTLIIN